MTIGTDHLYCVSNVRRKLATVNVEVSKAASCLDNEAGRVPPVDPGGLGTSIFHGIGWSLYSTLAPALRPAPIAVVTAPTKPVKAPTSNVTA